MKNNSFVANRVKLIWLITALLMLTFATPNLEARLPASLSDLDAKGSKNESSFSKSGNPNPGVLPPHAHAYGTTYGELAGDWWNWAVQFPFATNPIVEDGDVDCTRGQTGKVWFLAGTFDEEAVRRCTLPTGKALFFPLANGLFWVPEDGTTEEEVRAGVNEQIDGISELEASIDGTPLKELFSYRAESPPGGFVLCGPPECPLLADFGFGPGNRSPAVADGFWLLLAPLSKGDHEIHFHAMGSGFELDVRYFITVVGEKP